MSKDLNSAAADASAVDKTFKSVYRSHICARSPSLLSTWKDYKVRLYPTNAKLTRTMSLKNENDLGFYYRIPMKPQLGLVASSTNTTDDICTKEKYELSQLNDKFAIYIEKIRFLEAQNKLMEIVLRTLNQRKESYVNNARDMFNIEITEAKKLVEDIQGETKLTEEKTLAAEENVECLRRKLNEESENDYINHKKIAEMRGDVTIKQAKVNMLNMQLTELEEETKRQRHQIHLNLTLINQLTEEIREEALMKSNLENEKYAVWNEMKRLNQMYICELNELRTKILNEPMIDAPPLVFRDELKNAIENIRDECDTLNEQKRNDLRNAFVVCFNNLFFRSAPFETSKAELETARAYEEQMQYMIKTTKNEISRIRSFNEDLKERISKLEAMIDEKKRESEMRSSKLKAEIEKEKSRLHKLNDEYENVVSTRDTLENEIGQYRDLLEGSASNIGLRHFAQNVQRKVSVVAES